MQLLFVTLLVGVLQLQTVINLSNAAPNTDMPDTTEAVTASPVSEDDCFLKTKLGLLQGKVETSRLGKRYCSYLGVPYTNTPKRFEEAKMVGPWTGIRDATKFGSQCPSFESAFDMNKYLGEEDCLFVNIHYPIDDQCENQHRSNSTANEYLPVLAHIHGGAFEVGSGGDFGSKYIMDECMVFLSMNYRLGALGFLTTNDGLIPGNLGLKDQVLALKWTQANIGCFGGDPNSVTLIGISAGSSSIAHLIASSAAKGLFHRGILQSGSAIPSVLVTKNPTKRARALAKRLNCTVDDTTNTAALKECLLSADTKDIVSNQRLRDWNLDPFVPFAPVVENANASNPIHTVHPFYKLLTGDFNHVPTIQGFTEDEGVLLQAIFIINNPNATADLNTKWEKIAPISLYYDDIPQREKDHFSSKIREFYFGNKSVGHETFQDLINLNSDRYFVTGIMDTVELQSRYAPVYPYVFTYKKGFSILAAFGYTKPVATHGDDAQYLFPNRWGPGLKSGTPQEDFSKRLIKLWTTFAKTGNPSETWPKKNIMKPYKNDGVSPNNWYQIDEDITELHNYLQERRDFWRNLGLRNYDYPATY